MPLELTIVAIGALCGLVLVVGFLLTGGRRGFERDGSALTAAVGGERAGTALDASARAADSTLRLVWWITTTIVLVGVGISGTFADERGPIFALGAVAVAAVIAFHELRLAGSSRFGRLAEMVAATALVAGLLILTGSAASPFVMLLALVAVAAALGHGPRAGLVAAGLATLAFGAVVVTDPQLASYGPSDVLRLAVGLGAVWLLAFLSMAYAARHRRGMALSLTDPLTGLLNRSQLFATLEREVSRTRRSDRGFCLLMIDVDGLKAVNDRAGHLAGDHALTAIASVIAHSIRTVDSAYRYGGDEFVVLLPETDIVGAFVVAEKIRLGAEEAGIAIAPPDVEVSVSIGLVSHPEDGSTAEELIGAADRAMYQAKRLGKNQISGNPRPRPPLLARVLAPDGEIDAGEVAPSPEPLPETEQPSAREPAAIAVEAGPVVDGERAAAPPVGDIVVPSEADAQDAMRDADEDDQADPLEVRRRIASASRSFDPDDQIRRAMDAFLSPVDRRGERRPPDA